MWGVGELLVTGASPRSQDPWVPLPHGNPRTATSTKVEAVVVTVFAARYYLRQGGGAHGDSHDA